MSRRLRLMLIALLSLRPIGGAEVLQLEPTVVIGYRSSWLGDDSRAHMSNHLEATALQEQDLVDFEDVTQRVPNLRTQRAHSGGLGDVLSARGLTNSPLFGSPSVVIAVDGVSLPNPVVAWDDWVAIERVEVARGSQGTRFGRNPYGALIEVFRKQPGNVLEGLVSLDGGEYARSGVKAWLMGPLIADQWWFRLGGRYLERDGYLDHALLGKRPDNLRHRTLEGALIWKPTDQLEVEWAGNWLDYHDGSPRDTSIFSDPWESTTSFQGHVRRDVDQGSMRVRYEGDVANLVSITALSRSELDYRQDLDYLPAPLNDTHVHGRVDYLSQDVRVESSDDSSAFQWQLGLHASHIDTEGSVRSDTLGLVNHDHYRIEEALTAFYGEWRWQWKEHVWLEAGWRLDHAKKRLHGRFDDEREDWHWQPKLGVQIELRESLSAYSTVTYAAKPGGFSGLATDPTLAEFEEERAFTLECGLRAACWDDAFSFNLTAFYSEIDGYQVERQLTPLDYVVLNAERVTTYGAELDVAIALTESLSLQGGFGYTHIRFDAFEDPATGESFDGKIPPYVPEWDAYLAIDYQHDSGFFARAEYACTGRTQFHESNVSLAEEESHGILSAQVGWRKEDWALTVYGENLTNERYFASRNLDTMSGASGEPRHFGVRATYAF